MQNWHALRVMSNSEKNIASELQKLSVDCDFYYPKKTIWKKVHGARRKVVGASREKVSIALIKGYLFIKADLSRTGTEFWRRLRNVFGWVAVNGRPLVVGDLDRLIVAEENGDHDETIRLVEDLKKMIGGVYTMNDGLLRGSRVEVYHADEREISVSVRGSELRAKFPIDFFRNSAEKSKLDERV
jgi:transcription antitermination factor NusG